MTTRSVACPALTARHVPIDLRGEVYGNALGTIWIKEKAPTHATRDIAFLPVLMDGIPARQIMNKLPR